jgi:hypothetical protein
MEPGMDRLVVTSAHHPVPDLDRGESARVSAAAQAGPLGLAIRHGRNPMAKRKSTPLPPRSRTAPLALGALSAAGLPFLVWGLVVLDPWITLVGLAVQMTGKLWFLDRMALLYDDVSSAAVPAPPRTGR